MAGVWWRSFDHLTLTCYSVCLYLICLLRSGPLSISPFPICVIPLPVTSVNPNPLSSVSKKLILMMNKLNSKTVVQTRNAAKINCTRSPPLVFFFFLICKSPNGIRG